MKQVHTTSTQGCPHNTKGDESPNYYTHRPCRLVWLPKVEGMEPVSWFIEISLKSTGICSAYEPRQGDGVPRMPSQPNRKRANKLLHSQALHASQVPEGGGHGTRELVVMKIPTSQTAICLAFEPGPHDIVTAMHAQRQGSRTSKLPHSQVIQIL